MSVTDRRLTRRGEATRARIVETAAGLIYAHGVARTNNEAVRSAAGVSGSQLSHYFPDKESLLRAVLRWRADAMMGLHQTPPQGPPDSIAALRSWADSNLTDETVRDGGCSFGSLAAEVMKSGLDLNDEIAGGFDRWKAQLREGLTAMRAAGVLRPDADLEHLAYVLMAAFQGGMLLSQGARDVTPLRNALYGAIAYVETFGNA
ncbi:TetR/AcrR family transcriptional regulator [Asanoa siamensis]|uniref:Transcriptional regulator, TetR family protein n=1 Tax=Asanoa siamensis TaxID=926357 RepID=A0ABQ4CPY6_9ACTN|nr:TetR/AcrR family transcriptional regulator [Asanoa siamensis]GIF73340.1 putative transcriptional regulator, TetR family protein [Asanoa siamensis]